MIHFIFGLPGTGKTHQITQSIINDVNEGRRVLLIVPEQQTVEAERTMLKLLPPSAQLSFEVLNFSRLANKAFRTYGGLSYHYINTGMKHLIMWQTLRSAAANLREYASGSETDTSLPALMLSQIEEFKAYNVSAVKLASAAEKLPQESGLRSKLEDLSEIYAKYDFSVRSAYDDGADDLGKFADLLERGDGCRFFEDVNVYIDSFSSFTAQEYRILRRMFAQAEAVTIALSVDSPYSEAAELSSIADTARRLVTEAGSKAKITTLDTFHRFSSPELSRIANFLWRFESTGATLGEIPEESRGAVRIVRCHSPYEEAEAVANQILSLLAAGYRRREIAVIARDAEAYRGILDSALEKADISFFLSEKTDLPSKPLASMIFSALAIKSRNWRQNDVITYLKSGIPNVSLRDADILENYISTWRINGARAWDEEWTMNPEGYKDTLSERGQNMLDAANRVRETVAAPLRQFFIQLDGATNLAEQCEALRAFLENIDAAERMKQFSLRALRDGDRKEAAENSHTFRAITDVLSHIADALGDATMSVEEFSTALRLVFANTEIGTIPTAADQVVIGSASMLRAGGIRCAILIGICEGEFPARVSERGCFSDTDRRTLDGLGISLSGNTRDSAAEELLYCYRAMTLPSEKLILTYHDTNASGGTCALSLAVRRVAELLPHLAVKDLVEYGSESIEERLMTPALAFEALPSLMGTPYYAALVDVLSRDERYAPFLKRSEMPIDNADSSISQEVASSVFGKHISLTQTKIDKYVSCQFSYYCDFVLKLMECSKANFQSSNSGTFIHRILEVFMAAVTDENGLRRDVEFEEIRRMVVEETERYIAELCEGRKKLPKRLTHLFTRLSHLAVTIAMDLYAEFSQSAFVPRLFEAKIGNDSKYGISSPTVKLADGSTVSIYGTIDRVDVYKSGDIVYVKVVDYKTGKKQFSLKDIEKGLNVQLLLYLFAVCGSKSPTLQKRLGCDENGKIKPAGALYMSTAIPQVKLNAKTDEKKALSFAAASISRTGLLLNNDEILDAICKEKDPHFRAGVKDKKTKKEKDTLISDSGFTELENQLKETLRDIAREMKSGSAVTCVAKGESKSCKYCKMKQLCRAGSPVQVEEDDEEQNN